MSELQQLISSQDPLGAQAYSLHTLCLLYAVLSKYHDIFRNIPPGKDLMFVRFGDERELDDGFMSKFIPVTSSLITVRVVPSSS